MRKDGILDAFIIIYMWCR